MEQSTYLEGGNPLSVSRMYKEMEVSLPYLQETATGPFPEPAESSLSRCRSFFLKLFLLYLAICTQVSHVLFSLDVYRINLVCICCLPHVCYVFHPFHPRVDHRNHLVKSRLDGVTRHIIFSFQLVRPHISKYFPPHTVLRHPKCTFFSYDEIPSFTPILNKRVMLQFRSHYFNLLVIRWTGR